MDPLVSICCITYNHEKYIKEALDGFLMQKTAFQFEIIVHDDASTDKTPDIVKEYVNKYPDLIKPIFQIENQKSKKSGIVTDTVFNAAQGKYIALCEGDDYWNDPYKLQKQVDFMERNEDCSLCVHAANRISAKNNKLLKPIQPSKEDRYFSTEEIINGCGGLFSTNSMLFRTKYIKNLPFFFKNVPIGDYPLTIYLSLVGKVYYINQIMSVYRSNIKGSWTDRRYNRRNKKLNFNKSKKMMEAINKHTDYKYNELILKRIMYNRLTSLIHQGNFFLFLLKENRDLLKIISIKNILKLFKYSFYKLFQ